MVGATGVGNVSGSRTRHHRIDRCAKPRHRRRQYRGETTNATGVANAALQLGTGTTAGIGVLNFAFAAAPGGSDASRRCRWPGNIALDLFGNADGPGTSSAYAIGSSVTRGMPWATAPWVRTAS